MPIYVFKHPEKEQYVELAQSMSEKHIYFDDDGLRWERVYFSPQFNTQGKIDAFDNKKFVDKTGKMKGTYGDLMDYSKELSEERESKMGYDPVKKAYFDNYKKKNGRKHVNDVEKTSNSFGDIV